MIIDFSKIEKKVSENFKGGKGSFATKMYMDDTAKIMHGTLVPDSSIGYHKHETNSEVIYILSGNGKVEYDGKIYQIKCGEAHYCPQGHEHSLINDSDSDLVFFAFVPEL